MHDKSGSVFGVCAPEYIVSVPARTRIYMYVYVCMYYICKCTFAYLHLHTFLVHTHIASLVKSINVEVRVPYYNNGVFLRTWVTATLVLTLSLSPGIS